MSFGLSVLLTFSDMDITHGDSTGRSEDTNISTFGDLRWFCKHPKMEGERRRKS
jgi:hypothetical protein